MTPVVSRRGQGDIGLALGGGRPRGFNRWGEIYRNVLDPRGSMSARERPSVLEFRKVDYFEVVDRSRSRAEGLPR